jgi:hypothetical protein
VACAVAGLHGSEGTLREHHVCEVAAAEDKQPVETLGANGTNEALGVSVGLWRANRRVDDRDSFAAEDLVERGSEFSVAVVDHPGLTGRLGEGGLDGR